MFKSFFTSVLYICFDHWGNPFFTWLTVPSSTCPMQCWSCWKTCQCPGSRSETCRSFTTSLEPFLLWMKSPGSLSQSTLHSGGKNGCGDAMCCIVTCPLCSIPTCIARVFILISYLILSVPHCVPAQCGLWCVVRSEIVGTSRGCASHPLMMRSRHWTTPTTFLMWNHWRPSRWNWILRRTLHVLNGSMNTSPSKTPQSKHSHHSSKTKHIKLYVFLKFVPGRFSEFIKLYFF